MDDIFKFQHSDQDYYQILGCHPSSSSEQITTEYKNKALALHPDKQIDNKESEELFKQLVKAKDVLTDPEMRKSYDKWKSCGIAMSFDKWQRMGKDVQISMHWINRSSKDLMIGSGSQPTSDTAYHSTHNYLKPHSDGVNKFRDNHYDNDLIRKFRNYQV